MTVSNAAERSKRTGAAKSPWSAAKRRSEMKDGSFSGVVKAEAGL